MNKHVNKRGHYLMLTLILMVVLTGCTSQKESSMTEMVSWEIKVDDSIDSVEFKKQYKLNPDRWDKAFKFLRENDLVNLKIGRYELDGDKLFVNVDEYNTRPENEVNYEMHQKYADIQYLVFGHEKIAITSPEKLTPLIRYSEEKDIGFYEKTGEDNYRLADFTKFFIFFPENAHKPCVNADSTTRVRKVVIKVKL